MKNTDNVSTKEKCANLMYRSRKYLVQASTGKSMKDRKSLVHLPKQKIYSVKQRKPAKAALLKYEQNFAGRISGNMHGLRDMTSDRDETTFQILGHHFL